MSKEISILFVEDSPADGVIINHELRRAGLTFRLKRVESRDAFLQELTLRTPDLILSDHGLPSFDGFEALRLAREKCPEVPFIFVTAGLGEQKTIEVFENGADDCVLKNHMPKLGPAVHRALSRAQDRFRRQIADADRERLIGELHAALMAKRPEFLVPICSSCKKIRDVENRWLAIEIYLRDHFDLNLTHGLCPECADRMRTEMEGNDNRAA